MDGIDVFKFSRELGRNRCSGRAEKKEDIFKTDENRKEICAAAKGFYENALLGTVYRLRGCAWGCTL